MNSSWSVAQVGGKQPPRSTPALLLAAASLAFYAIGAHAGSHANSDGVIYAQMAREQLQRGDFIDTTWLGVVQFEKPPLLIWSLATSGAVFGWSEAAMRLPMTLFAVAGLLALYALALGLGLPRRAALTASALLATSTLYLWLTRSLMTDVPLLAGALGSAACLLHGRATLAGALAGAALLAKGPAALPLLAAGGGYALYARQLTWRNASRFLLALTLVAAPWYVAVSLRHGHEFWAAHIGYHLIARRAGGVVPALQPSEQLTVLASERLLALLALVGFGMSLRERLRLPVDKFAFAWLLASIAPLAVSNTRLAQYFLPLVAAWPLLAVRTFPAALVEHRRAPLAAAALVLAAFLATPVKLITWLDPDFGPDPKAIGLRLAHDVKPGDSIVAYNATSPALVFYSGGLPIDTYADDDKFLAILRAVLIYQRQAGSPGQVVDVREHPFPRRGRRFIVTAREADANHAAAALGVPTRVQRSGELWLVSQTATEHAHAQLP